jgi:colanic acid/amylovoran biosynthesis protein
VSRPKQGARIAGDVPRSVVITNVFADDNRGGAAITAATIDTVHEAFPEANVSLLAIGSDPDRLPVSHRHTCHRYPDVEVLPAPLPVASGGRVAGLRSALATLAVIAAPGRARSRSTRALVDAGLIVSKGGHVFVERETLRGVLSLWMTVWPLVLGWRLGIPTVVFCSSVGPYATRASRILNSFVLRRVSLILARDPLSHEAAVQLGVAPSRVVEVPDSVFGFEPPSQDETGAVVRQLGLEESTFGVLTVRRVGDRSTTDAFLDDLAMAARTALRAGLVDRLVVVVQVDGPTATDLPVSQRLVDAVGDPRVTLIDDDLSPRELMALYAAASFVVGTRMHSTIFAMVAGTPAVAIAVRGAKARGIYRGLGIEDLIIDRAKLTPEGLGTKLQEIVDRGQELRAVITSTVEAARARSSANPELLRRAASGD